MSRRWDFFIMMALRGATASVGVCKASSALWNRIEEGHGDIWNLLFVRDKGIY